MLGNICNRMLQAYAPLVRGLTCFKKRKTLGYMKIIVCKISLEWGANPYLSHGLIGRGGHQTGISEYQVLRGLVETKCKRRW